MPIWVCTSVEVIHVTLLDQVHAPLEATFKSDVPAVEGKLLLALSSVVTTPVAGDQVIR